MFADFLMSFEKKKTFNFKMNSYLLHVKSGDRDRRRKKEQKKPRINFCYLYGI